MEMSKNRKFIIIAIVIFVIAIICLISLSYKNNGLYILVSPNTVFTYNDGGWSVEGNKAKFNKGGYEVYNNNKLAGTFKAKYNSDELIYEFNKTFKEKEDFTDLFIAFRGKTKYSVENINVKTLDNSDYSNILNILRENNISYVIKNLPVSGKLEIDMNNDKVNEKIYYLSNTFDDTSNQKAFSIIAIVHNNKISYIHREVVGLNNMYDICMPYIHSVIDVEQDNNLEIITGCAYFSNIGTKNYIFNIEDNNYNLLATNEIKE